MQSAAKQSKANQSEACQEVGLASRSGRLGEKEKQSKTRREKKC